MKKLLIQPSKAKGSLSLPPSKSHTQRALLFSLMAKGLSKIKNPLISPDTKDMLAAIKQLGAICKQENSREIQILGTGGNLTAPEDVIWAGNSGQVLRFVGAFAALLPTYTVLTGDKATKNNRPVTPLLQGIEQLGGFAVSARQNGTAPIIIKGPIAPGKIVIGGECSQPISAFLMACSFLPSSTEILVQNAKEKPWIALTLHWMKKLGLAYEEENLERFIVKGKGSFNGFDCTIPGDLSSAAFPVVAALITGSFLTIEGFDSDSCQGDGKLFKDLVAMGAKLEYQEDKHALLVHESPQLQGGILDVGDYIDAVPILSVLGCFCKNPLTLKNGAHARKKESDRLSAITQELRKMGATIEEEQDSLIIFPSLLQGATVQSWQDHRIAMALCCAGLAAFGSTIVEDIDCIDKSYPSFQKDFAKLGFKVTKQ